MQVFCVLIWGFTADTNLNNNITTVLHKTAQRAALLRAHAGSREYLRVSKKLILKSWKT